MDKYKNNLVTQDSILRKLMDKYKNNLFAIAFRLLDNKEKSI